ncbi:MAG: hypothetical protein JW724_05185 [Candidatus Altiarchaeota archaeon]|nr:hypothetical protein [Candidatus Altiarchaeota archaeon]
MNLNQTSYGLLEGLKEHDCVQTVEYATEAGYATVLDAGVKAEIDGKKAWEIGLKIAEASMGSLGKAEKKGSRLSVEIPRQVAVATLGCQLAGWPIELSGKKSLGSGPARILAKKPAGIIDVVGYTEKSEKAALILETCTLPGKETCEGILKATGADSLIIAAFRGDYIVGLVNVLARIVEVGVYRLHNIGFDVKKIVSARGSVPVPPLDDDVMYTSNDAIIYQGTVSLEVECWNPQDTKDAISKASPAYGKRFKEIYEEAGGNFYGIDPRIFAPAILEVLDLSGGRGYSAGEVKNL